MYPRDFSRQLRSRLAEGLVLDDALRNYDPRELRSSSASQRPACSRLRFGGGEDINTPVEDVGGCHWADGACGLSLRPNSTTTPNKADAQNPAMTSLFQIGRHRRRVCDLRRSAATRRSLDMRFHLGTIPSSPDFVPDASWRSLRQPPSPWLENLLALPIGVVAAVTVAALWYLVTPLPRHYARNVPAGFPAFVCGARRRPRANPCAGPPDGGAIAALHSGLLVIVGFYAHYDAR